MKRLLVDDVFYSTRYPARCRMARRQQPAEYAHRRTYQVPTAARLY